MRPRLLLLPILLFFALPAFATEWHPFSIPYRSGPTAAPVGRPAIAGYGDEYLVAWSQRGLYYFTRMTADGRIIGEVATPLDGSSYAYGDISIAGAPGGYFAVWSHTATTFTAALLDPNGQTIRRTEIDGSGWAPLLASNAKTFLVVRNYPRFTAALFDASGNLIQQSLALSPDIIIDDAAAVGDERGFLFVATRYIEATNETQIIARRVGTDGTLGPWQVLASTGPVFNVVATNDGVRDRIAWSGPSGSSLLDVDARTDEHSAPVALAVPRGSTIAAMQSSRGTTWISWTSPTADQTEVWVAKVAADGSLSATTDVGSGYYPAMASTTASAALVYEGTRDPLFGNQNDIHGRLLDPAISEDFIVSKSRAEQSSGALSGDGVNTLAVWSEQSGGRPQIYAGRLSSQGVPLDGAGIQLSASGANLNPVAAFNGVDWLVVWNHYDDDSKIAPRIVARRIGSRGVLLDSADIEIAGSSSAPRITSDGSNWLVGWIALLTQQRACNNLGGASRAMATLVSPAGLVLNPLGKMLAAPDVTTDQTQLDVAWDGSRYVAVWTEQCGGYHTIPFVSLTAARMPADLSRVEPFGISGGAAQQQVKTPRIVACGGKAFAIWQLGYGTDANTGYARITSAPSAGRHRAVGAPLVAQRLDGVPIGVAATPVCGFAVVTQSAAKLSVTNVASTGEQMETTTLGAVAPDEIFTGSLLLQNNSLWLAEMRFDPADGALRLWVREER